MKRKHLDQDLATRHQAVVNGEAPLANTSLWDALRTKTVELNDLDTQISEVIQKTEAYFGPRCQRLVWTPLDEGVKLAWSRHRPTRKYPEGRWRFVVQDAEGATELLSTSREERLHAMQSGAFARLVEQLKLTRP